MSQSENEKKPEQSQKKPSGGYDSTPLKPTSGPTYTVKFTFHRAFNLPISDYGSRSSDPFVIAQIDTSLPTRHSQDPPIQFRSPTQHRTLEPKWNSEWIVAGVPASGFNLTARLFDEDPGDHDDKLGKVEVSSGRLGKDWQGMKEEEHKIKKTGADVFAYSLRWARKVMCRGVELHGRMVLSIEVLGETKEEVGKVYTVNNFWWTHYSPMIGRLTGTKASDDHGVEKSDFQANEMQLQGPVPTDLYHRYVNFRPFIGGMFEGAGVRGRILHKALHHQHERIYNFNPQTKYGTLPDGPGNDMTLKFLDMVQYDTGGRIFTYVITLDGMFRFCETGKEFGIDLLSKHTMHSDVNIYIAWSGEFFIRRLAHPKQKASDPDQHTHPSEDLPGGPPNDAPPKDPAHYELIIDNDSGTYRPDSSLIPTLKKFLRRNFPGLHISVKACDDDRLQKMKDEQRKIKKKEGDHRVYGQGSDTGSVSSSDVSSLNSRADLEDGGEYRSGLERGVAALENPRQAMKDLLHRGDKEEHGDAEAELAPEGTEAAGKGEDGNAQTRT